MLKGLLKNQFSPQKESTNTYYNVTEINYLTLRFSADLYFVGFVRNSNAHERYIIGNTYTVNMIFPSIDLEAYGNLLAQIAKKDNISICLGKSVIGSAYFETYEYLE